MPNIRFSMSKLNLFSSKETVYKRPISKCYFAFLFSISVLQFPFFVIRTDIVYQVLSMWNLVWHLIFEFRFSVFVFCNLHLNCLQMLHNLWVACLAMSNIRFSMSILNIIFQPKKNLTNVTFKNSIFFISVFNFLWNRKNKIIKLKSKQS